MSLTTDAVDAQRAVDKGDEVWLSGQAVVLALQFNRGGAEVHLVRRALGVACGEVIVGAAAHVVEEQDPREAVEVPKHADLVEHRVAHGGIARGDERARRPAGR